MKMRNIVVEMALIVICLCTMLIVGYILGKNDLGIVIGIFPILAFVIGICIGKE